MTHTYTIHDLLKDSSTGVVSKVWYGITTQVGGDSNMIQEIVHLSGSNSDDGFIAYDSLTESDVLGWVHATKDEIYVETEASQSFEKYIKAKNTSNGLLPW